MKLDIQNAIRAGAISAALVLTACSSLPQQVDLVEQARANLRSAEQDSMAQEAASVELAAARDALSAADAAYDRGDDLGTVEYHAYVANRHAQIAAQRIAEAHAREQLGNSRARREEVQLQARQREAKRAKQHAAQLAAQLDDAEHRAERLAAQLDTVKASQTERGMVLTLGDILFDTDASKLKAGAASTLDQVGEFLNQYPERRVRIEGYADARGPMSYNDALSAHRADAVEDALEARGVDDQRIQTVGLGERYPIATNETAAGRQQNRRVELVLSDANGDFPIERERTASRG